MILIPDMKTYVSITLGVTMKRKFSCYSSKIRMNKQKEFNTPEGQWAPQNI